MGRIERAIVAADGRDLAGAFSKMSTPDQLYDQAVDLRDAGDKPGAIVKLEEAVAIDPNFVIGHGMLAKLYVDLAESDEAIFHAKKVVELEPDDTFSYTALSVIYQRCGKIPEAEHAKALAQDMQYRNL